MIPLFIHYQRSNHNSLFPIGYYIKSIKLDFHVYVYYNKTEIVILCKP